MTSTYSRNFKFFLAAAAFAALAPRAEAQIATLDKGHQILVNNGLQIWGAATDILNYDVNYASLQNANMNGVIWGFPANGTTPANGGTDIQALSPGNKWGKWTDWQYNGTTITPQTALTAAENARKSDLIALQVGDEINQSDMETGTKTRDWLLAAGNGTSTTADDVFPNSLLYVNSFHIINHSNYGNFLATANPDAISWDSYPFANPHGHYITPTNWLALGQQFRRHGLGSYIGATNAPPRPYGMFVQTFNDTFAVDPGEVEIRWQQFAAWTMGYKFVDAYIFSGGNNNFGNNPAGPVYQHFQETSRQSRNLGPALTRLISYGYGTSILQGKNAAGQTNPVPGDWLVFNKNNAPPNQQYLSSLSAVNLGTKNGGHPGDVYVGFFNPLHASFGNPAGEVYFMVMNGLGGDLQIPNGQGGTMSDNTATVAQTQQQITLDFDMGTSTINSLQRLRRSDGQVEVVPLTHVSGRTWRLTFNLDGGTGDLFKYNDGQVFVGAQAVQPTVYWDSDANPAGNNTSTGGGMGGAGTWDGGAKWFNGSSNSAWSANQTAVFWGTGGIVTLSAPRSVDGLTLKSNGYTLASSTLTLNRPFVTVDSGVTATIGSVVAGSIGLSKSGAGTLVLTNSNTYTGGTTVNGGAVQVGSDAALGAAPGALQTSISLDGGTLRWGANFDLSNNRAIALGPAGGTIDTQGFSNSSGYTQPNGIFGSGNLTKLGSGTFFMNTPAGQLNNGWTGNLILKEGTWKITERGGLPFNPPQTPGSPVVPGQITFDGGTLQIAGAIPNVTNGRRGITVEAGGGTFDTQGFTFNWAGPLAGNVTTAVLTKIGTGTLQFNTNAVPAPSTYAGVLHVAQGSLVLNGGAAMGDLAAITLANSPGVLLTISGGSETIGSLSGGGIAGGEVMLSAATLTTGGNDSSTTFAGVIKGSGIFRKAGTGKMTLTRFNEYTGLTIVAGGTLAVNGSIETNATVENGATLGGTGEVKGTTTVQSGGALSPGNSPGSLTLGALSMQNGSTLDIELGPMSDSVSVTTSASLNGTLDVSLAGGFVPNIGQSFIVLSSATRNGMFSNEPVLTISNRKFDVIYNPQTVVVQVVPQLPGDFNADGTVDTADLVIWQKTFTTTFPNGYNDWRTHYGESLPSGNGSAAPEPSSWMLIGTLLAGATAVSPRLRRGFCRRLR
jgi:autotransporter-associated beta strand protein